MLVIFVFVFQIPSHQGYLKYTIIIVIDFYAILSLFHYCLEYRYLFITLLLQFDLQTYDRPITTIELMIYIIYIYMQYDIIVILLL